MRLPESLRAWCAERRHGLKAIGALVGVDILDSQLSQGLTFAGFLPPGFVLVWQRSVLVLGVLLCAAGLHACMRHRHRLLRGIVMAYLGVATFQLFASVAGMVLMLSAFKTGVGAFQLLWNVIGVWVINVVVFSVWYWQLDSGGPHRRGGEAGAMRADFFFPQRSGHIRDWPEWSPDFADYLFLSFTTSTTFGPADTPPLSHRAKLLMMLHVGISLIVLTVLAARAVSIIS